MIINLRGTNGSGKSTAVVGLLVPEMTEEIQLGGAKCTTDGMTLLIGAYPPGKTGGCDRVKTFDIMRAAIKEASQQYPLVLFEGITVSTTFGSWANFCEDEVPFVWAYLDTPVDLCVARVKARNGGAPFDEGMVRSKYRSIQNTRAKAIQIGFRVADINHLKATDELQALARLG